jgi:exodeoxyribonuclease-1
MKNFPTFYWHDYETWGARPAIDRPVQFAGVRTDTDFNIVGDPLVVYCQPPLDYLPEPDACLITGITPQLAAERGVPENRFIAAIHAELSRPGTCGVGYNSLRFDDEVTRYALYRNFLDPYGREWQNGNSRWDLIDLLRTCRTLRPEGIEWPNHADGSPSFKLEHLTAANGIAHEAAHDALSDVYATIAVARLVRERQPGLYDYYLKLRNKREVAALLDPVQRKPVLHFSGRLPAARGCGTLVLPLARHPSNANGIICYDLSVDPTPLLTLDAEAIRARIFVDGETLRQQGLERIPLKVIHMNRCPMVATARLLDAAVAGRMALDRALCERHYQQLYGADLTEKLGAVFAAPATAVAAQVAEAEQQLYQGFIGDGDRALMSRVARAQPEQLIAAEFPFGDPRLRAMLARYRARNFPETLDPAAQAGWLAYCRQRLLAGPGITLSAFRARIEELRGENAGNAHRLELLDQLARHGEGMWATVAGEAQVLAEAHAVH